MSTRTSATRRIEKRVTRIGREARAAADRAQRQARELADDAVVFGLGAPAYALDKVGRAARDVIDAPSRAGKRTKSKDVAQRAKRAVGRSDPRPYEERTREELYELAREHEIEGRSSMSKRKLIAALRK